MRNTKILLLAVVATVLMGCQKFYSFENRNLRAVEAENLVPPPPPPIVPKAIANLPVAHDESLATLAMDIANGINSSADFKNAGVSAGTPVATGAQVSIALTYDPLSTITLSGSAKATGAAKASEILTTASTSAGVTTLTLSGTTTAGDTVTVTGISPTIRDALGALVNQSEQNCANFLAALVLFQTGTNTTLDVLSTITSAVGTVLAPIETVHALSASTSILTGSKTALDSDIYAKASIANFASAIQATYYANMTNYVTGLAAADPSTLIWPIEVYKITVIHRECALAPAESAISKTLEGASSAPPPAALTVTFTATDTKLATVATNIYNQIKNSPAFQNAGVSASSPVTTVTNKATIALNYPATTSISWSSSTNGAETITFPSASVGVTLTITGTVAIGDTITITGTLAAGQAGTGKDAGTTSPATTPAPPPPGSKIKS